MEKRTTAPEDMYKLAYPGDISVSPDGRTVAYTVTRLDKEKDESRTDLYIYSLDSGESRRLTYGGKEGKAHFSPDGRRLAFVSGRDEKSQIYVMELSGGGEPWRLTTAESVGGQIGWFPCGRRIAYSARVYSRPDAWEPYAGAPEGDAERLRKLAEKAHADKKPDDNKKDNLIKVIERFSYRRDGAGYFGDAKEQVFVRDVPGRAPDTEVAAAGERITAGDFDHSGFDISPDGKIIVVSARRDADADLNPKKDLWVFPVDGGEPRMLYEAPGPAGQPRFSPCGGHLTFLGHGQESGMSTTTGLYLLKLKDGTAQGPALAVTRAFDRPALGGGFWQDDSFVFSLADRGCVHVYAASTSGELRPALAPEQTSLLNMGGAGGTLAYVKGRYDLLEEVWVSHLGEERQISDLNGKLAEELTLSPARHIVYASDDGQEIDGWFVLPPDGGSEGLPLILFIHGGPHGWYGPRFMLDAQAFAARGYAVLLTNPRGSESYGQRFADIIDGNWGDLDYRDVMAGVAVLQERGIVDPSRMYAQGWSYGGYLACWLVTRTDAFGAVCAGAPVSNLLSGYGTSDITLADEHEYGGKPWENAAHMLSQSALSFADRVKTPFMLMHGENDLRCPVSQSEEFYIALKRLGKEAVMIRYPGEYHGLKRPLHRLDKLERQLAWFDYYRNTAMEEEQR